MLKNSHIMWLVEYSFIHMFKIVKKKLKIYCFINFHNESEIVQIEYIQYVTVHYDTEILLPNFLSPSHLHSLSLTPVSYTHLDVYKRQFFYYVNVSDYNTHLVNLRNVLCAINNYRKKRRRVNLF